MLSGAAWQRCRVHFMRNLLATVPQAAREPIAAIVRTIFAQPDHASALAQLHKVADGLRTRLPAGRRAARGGRRGHPGAHALSRGAPPAAAQHESAGAAEQGDQAPLERRRHLPQRPRQRSAWSAPSCSSRTTNGRSPSGATSARSRWSSSTSPSLSTTARRSWRRSHRRNIELRMVRPHFHHLTGHYRTSRSTSRVAAEGGVELTVIRGESAGPRRT